MSTPILVAILTLTLFAVGLLAADLAGEYPERDKQYTALAIAAIACVTLAALGGVLAAALALTNY